MASSSTNTSPADLTPKEVSTTSVKHLVEARRAEAECRKLELEALEIQKRLNVSWYQGRFLLQTGLGAVVASALLAAWLITYMQPILNRKQEIASLDATIQAKTNEQQRLENERRTEILAQENKSIRNQLTSLSELNSSLNMQQARVEQHATELQRTLLAQAEQLKKLAKQKQPSSIDTQQLGYLAQKAQTASENVEQQLAGLRADQSASEARGKDIASSILANALRDTTWRDVCENCPDEFRTDFIRLRGDGALGRNHTSALDFDFTVPSSWKVENGILTLSWNKGYSTETYTFPTPTSSKAKGSIRSQISSVDGPVSIEKVE